MSYLSVAEYLARFGERETILLTNEESSVGPTYDASKVESAIGDATEIVEGYIGARYAIPLADPPGIVKGWTGALARQALYVNVGIENEAARLAADRVFVQLRDVQAGRMSLPVPEGGAAPEGRPGGTLSSSDDAACATFGGTTLDRFMGPFGRGYDVPCWRQ